MTSREERPVDSPTTDELESLYAAAWDEWAAGDDEELWEPTAGDGIEP